MRFIIALLIILASSTFLATIGGCSASADDCTAVCNAQAPPGGTEYCESGPTYANCYAYDADMKLVQEDEQTCVAPGGGGGGGGSGGGVDPLWCALNWWICDPFAL